MATIRKRLGKWQVQIRRKNYPNIIKTFIEKSSADKYVREIEVLKIKKTNRRDGRVVEDARLESVYTVKSIKGSNPFLSSKII